MSAAIWSILIQLMGSTASAAAAVLVSATMGLAAQGEFGLLRSWNDVLIMAAVFGLPQGLLHLQYREDVPASALWRWISSYLCVVGLVAACAVAIALLLLWLAPLPHLRQFAVLAAALPFAAAHLLWRALALRGAGVVPYAAVTAAPALLILCGLTVMSLIGWNSGFEWVLWVAYASCALFALWLIRDTRRTRAVETGWPRSTLWSVSAQTGAQGLLTALLPASLLSLSGTFGATLAEIGIVSLGFQLYMVFGAAAVYLAPLLYDRAARSRKPADSRRWLGKLLQRVRVGWLAAAALLGPALPWIAAAVWDSARALAPSLSLMALAGELALVVRVLWTLQQARGAYALLSGQSLARLIFAAALASLLLQHQVSASWAVPLAMLAIEALTLASLAVRLRAELRAAGSPPAA